MSFMLIPNMLNRDAGKGVRGGGARCLKYIVHTLHNVQNLKTNLAQHSISMLTP